MKQFILTVWQFYRDGFRSMKLGRTLWLIILIKLFVMFFILRIFFFPDFPPLLNLQSARAPALSFSTFNSCALPPADF